MDFFFLFCMFLYSLLLNGTKSDTIIWNCLKDHAVVAYVCCEAVGSSQCVAEVGLSWQPQGKSPHWAAHCLLSTKMSMRPSEGT